MPSDILLGILILVSIALIARIRTNMQRRAEGEREARERFEQHRREFLSHGFPDEED